MKCRLCERQAENDLCRYHLEAKGNLEAAYAHWVEAYGSLSHEEYLRRVAKNPESGAWAVEVAKMMLESGK
ncbi:MAG: hypothetical protein JRM80_07635 [Nitrososphaerota archaeon]|nr:hypothetical protein [Nitrososphaerota archaeon]